MGQTEFKMTWLGVALSYRF